MWPLGELLAAEAPANDSLIVVVGGIIVAAIGALGLVITEIVKGRDARPTPAPPPSTVTGGQVDLQALAADVAVLKDHRVQTMKADTIHEKLVYGMVEDVKDLVRWMDREHPGWRP